MTRETREESLLGDLQELDSIIDEIRDIAFSKLTPKRKLQEIKAILP